MTPWVVLGVGLAFGGFLVACQDRRVLRDPTLAEATARFIRGIRALEERLGRELLPAIQRACAAVAGFGAAFRRS